MSEFRKILWGFMAIAFGWFLNQAGQWFRTRHDDKRNLKQVIYNLLEVYHWLLRSDFDFIRKTFVVKAFSKIPKEEQTIEMNASIDRFFVEFIGRYIKPEIIKELNAIEGSFQQSIKMLAAIDPLTAFQLSGKTTIVKRWEMVEGWFSEIKNDISDETKTVDFTAQKTLGILKPDLMSFQFKEVADEIVSLAWKVNPVMWWRTKKLVAKMKKAVTTDLEQKMDELMNLPTGLT